jgi:topoisomerase-4 subunit A
MSDTFPEQPQSRLHRLFDRNFLDYTAYVIRERAIPDIDDGLKPVQRRILQTLRNMDDGRYHKVANVVGETMKLHPHGDQSIFAALVNLANKELLIDRQGNFGNVFTGDQASAARYIECRLTPLARETLFNPDLTAFVDSYDGRMQEPVSLPSTGTTCSPRLFHGGMNTPTAKGLPCSSRPAAQLPWKAIATLPSLKRRMPSS